MWHLIAFMLLIGCGVIVAMQRSLVLASGFLLITGVGVFFLVGAHSYSEAAVVIIAMYACFGCGIFCLMLAGLSILFRWFSQKRSKR